MDPFTLVSTAISIAKSTGLDKKIGGLLAGEKGVKVAESVFDTAKKVTGEHEPEKILAHLEQDPAALERLKHAILEQHTELARLTQLDRMDARAMQRAALRSRSRISRHFLYYFSWFWAVVSAGYIVGITFLTIPQENVRFADTVLGFVLGTLISSIISFFYGSKFTHDSTDKMDH